MKNISAIEMAAKLSEIFTVEQLGTGGRTAAKAPAKPTGKGGAAAPKDNPQDLSSQLVVKKLLFDERTNNLIIMANEPAYRWLRVMVNKLDVKLEGEEWPRSCLLL